ncbi:MAG: chorismate mutase [Anaerolineaceae bacterium]|mgnify:CR=1 FL=1|nr:chorismate mutase [Anaerolineaceae bacterium]
MLVRGARGAITVSEDTEDAILVATEEVLRAMIEANDIREEMVASALFTTTPDLTSCYPAKAARLIGWTNTALLGFQEIQVPTGLKMCIRVLIHWNTDLAMSEVEHIYLRGAQVLRPDWKKV